MCQVSSPVFSASDMGDAATVHDCPGFRPRSTGHSARATVGKALARYNRHPQRRAMPRQYGPSHARLFRGRRPLQGRHDPRRQRFLAPGRSRLRQAPENQGGDACCCALPSRRHPRCSPARRSSPPSSTRISCGRSPATTSSAFLDLAREYFGHAPLPVEAAATALALHAAPMYFYKRGKGRYRKAPPDALTAALASIERKRREAEQTAGWIADLSARRLPAGAGREAPDAALQARQERDRVEGADGGVRRAAAPIPSRCSPNAGRFRRRTSTTTSAFWPRPFRTASRFRRRACCRRVPELPLADVRGVLDRRRTRPPRSTTRSRCATCRTATTRSASTSPRPRSRFRADRRSTPRRARGCRPSTCPAARSRCCRKKRLPLHAGGGHAGARAVAVRGNRRRRQRHPPRDAASTACRSPRTCVWARSASISPTTCPRRADPPWNAELRVLWKVAQKLSATRGKPDIERARLQLLRGLGRGARRPRIDRAADARLAGRQARLRADDLRQQHLGQGAVRRARRRPLPHPVRRQGEDEHAPRRAPGPGPRPLSVGELAAAPLQRPRQPAPAAGRASPATSRRTPTTTPSCSPR